MDNTHEVNVSLETAKLLKKAGFDWPCISYYQHGKFYSHSIDHDGRLVVFNASSAPDYMEQYSAPTLSVAQRWLREVHHLNIEIRTIPVLTGVEYADIECNEKGIVISEGFLDYKPIYEESLEAGIENCLTILLGDKHGK